MSDTTTIEITQAQKANLDGLKDHSRESYKSVLDRLLEGDVKTVEVVKASDVDGFESTSQTVDLEATTVKQIAEQVAEELR